MATHHPTIDYRDLGIPDLVTNMDYCLIEADPPNKAWYSVSQNDEALNNVRNALVAIMDALDDNRTPATTSSTTGIGPSLQLAIHQLDADTGCRFMPKTPPAPPKPKARLTLAGRPIKSTSL